MKSIKIAYLAMAATLALGAYSAKAAVTIVGTTTEYSKVTFSATIQTNKPETFSGNTYKYTIGKMKVTNKDLINLFCAWSTNIETQWQNAGAQLIYDWNSDQICVADKTATNILFYAGTGVTNGTVEAYLDVDWYDEGGVYTGTYVDTTPGKENYTEYYTGYFELYYWNEGNSSVYVDLYAYTPSTEKYSESWTSTTDKWSETDTFTLGGAGYFLDEDAVFNGKITAKGSGNYVE